MVSTASLCTTACADLLDGGILLLLRLELLARLDGAGKL